VVRLTTSNPAVLKLDYPALLVTLGRIRAIVLDQCPSVEVLSFDGVSGGNNVFAAEVTRLTKWRRYAAIDPSTHRLACQGAPPNSSECDKRIAAYVSAKQMLRGPQFADTEITTLLDISTEDHLVWRTGSVLGKLQLTNIQELAGQFTSNAALADAIIGQSAQACQAEGGVPGEVAAGDYVGDLAYRSVSCQPAGRQAHQSSTLIASRDGWFYVFSLWAEAPHAGDLDDLALTLLQSAAVQ